MILNRAGEPEYGASPGTAEKGRRQEKYSGLISELLSRIGGKTEDPEYYAEAVPEKIYIRLNRLIKQGRWYIPVSTKT